MTATKPPEAARPVPPVPAQPRRRRKSHPRSIAASARGVHTLLGAAIFVTAGLLVTAWFLPLMTVRKMIFWRNEVSIIDTARILWAEGDIYIFLVVTVFSMVFPVFKLLAAFLMWWRMDATNARVHRYVGFIQSLGKWSMVDVFVVALVVVAVKISIVSNVSVHSGIYVFTAAIFLSILVMHWLERLIKRAGRDAERERAERERTERERAGESAAEGAE